MKSCLAQKATLAVLALGATQVAAAQEISEAERSFGARALTKQVAALTAEVELLRARNAALAQVVKGLAGQVAVLLANDSSLATRLACLGPESGPGQVVLQGCDLIVRQLDDGSGTFGNVEIEGALAVSRVTAQGDAGTLRVEGADAVVLRSGSATQQLQRDGDIVITGKDVDVRGSGEVSISAAGDLVLRGARILQN